MLLLHLRLDERVARLPHDRAAAVLRDVVVERLRALHLAEDRGARVLLEHARARRGSSACRPRRCRRSRRRRRGGPRRRRTRCRRARPSPSRASMSASRFFGTVGSGWWFGKRPSISQKSASGSRPSVRRHRSPSGPPAPLPASSTTEMGDVGTLDVARHGRDVLVVDVDRLDLAARRARQIAAPRSSRGAPGCRRRRSSRLPRIILKPFSSAGVVAPGDHHAAVGVEVVHGEVEHRRRARRPRR